MKRKIETQIKKITLRKRKSIREKINNMILFLKNINGIEAIERTENCLEYFFRIAL